MCIRDRLSTLCLPDQKAENIERMTLEQAKTVLASEFEKGYQGILIGVHTLAALKLLNVHLAVMHAQLDYVLAVSYTHLDVYKRQIPVCGKTPLCSRM